MSPGGNGVREDASRQRFDLVMRGYDKRQVDQFASRADSEIAMLMAERERAREQFHAMAQQIQQLQGELAEARQRPAQIDKATFKDLGPMVEQILQNAEKQAAQITSTASERVANHRAQAEKALADAHERANRIVREYEEEVANRRAELQQTAELRRAGVTTVCGSMPSGVRISMSK